MHVPNVTFVFILSKRHETCLVVNGSDFVVNVPALWVRKSYNQLQSADCTVLHILETRDTSELPEIHILPIQRYFNEVLRHVFL